MSEMRISLSWKECEAIARHYRFPTVIFLFDEKIMLRKMRGVRKCNHAEKEVK